MKGYVDEERFDVLRFNVVRIPHGKDLLYDPEFGIRELRSLDSFQNYDEGDKNKIIRYILLMHDKKTPLRRDIADLQERKEQAAILAGFDLEKNEERLEEIFTLSDDRVADMIIEWMEFQGNRLVVMIDTNEQMFFDFNRAALEKVSDVNNDKQKMDAVMVKAKLSEECEKIDARLEIFYEKLYGDPDVIEVVQRRKFTPESMAK